MTVFLTKGKKVFHVPILYLACLGGGYTSDRISYGRAYTCRPCHAYYVTAVEFVFPYVHTTLAHPCTTVRFVAIAAVCICVIATVWIGVIRSLAHSFTILWLI